MILKWMTVFLGATLLVADMSAAEPMELKTQKDRVNYGIGVTVVRNYKQQGIDIDLDILIQGMKDALSGSKLKMSEDELRVTMTSLQTQLILQQRRAKRASLDNKNQGEMFLAENKKKKGVIVLADGLQYKVIEQGKGRNPKHTDTVVYHYRGTHTDGTEFDSTFRAKKPVTSRVADAAIPGLVEGLKLMPVGSKWQLFIPAQLAHGERGEGSKIGPNETLIYEVELLSIK
jgi:FKBP-type peptidyl-prolyl cis-trans isomerase FklB